MATAKIYFDTRRANKDGTCPLRIFISRKGQRASMVTGITLHPGEWDGNKVVKRTDAKFLNTLVEDKLAQINKALLQLDITGKLSGRSAQEVLQLVQEYINPEKAEKRAEEEKRRQEEENSFAIFFRAFMDTKKNAGTKGLYEGTYKKLECFCGETGKDFSSLTFDDITKQFLEDFEEYCLKTQRQNTASRHLRDIRAVFNAAIDEEKTLNYPFRKLKIRREESRDKSFAAKELRQLFSYECYPGCEQEAVDIFKLQFCLIGINSVDLVYLSPAKKGRVDYIRRKTHKPYSIKIVPEAQEIIDKYKGESYLLNILDRCPNYKTYFNRIGKALKTVGKTRVAGKESSGKALFPDICMGSARTSWSTIAQEELGIDRETIAAALGHHTVDVTSTYLRTDWKKKVDEANRKVLDWVFYSKRKKRSLT